MKPTIQKLWFYFRTGHNAYLSLAVSIVQFLLVGTLYLQRIPGLSGIRLTELALIFVMPYAVAAVLIGWLHRRRQMQTDTLIAVLSNPYVFKLLPGKEEKIMIPATILGLKVQRAIMNNLDVMTPELEADFTTLESLLKRLQSGDEIK